MTLLEDLVKYGEQLKNVLVPILCIVLLVLIYLDVTGKRKMSEGFNPNGMKFHSVRSDGYATSASSGDSGSEPLVGGGWEPPRFDNPSQLATMRSMYNDDQINTGPDSSEGLAGAGPVVNGVELNPYSSGS